LDSPVTLKPLGGGRFRFVAPTGAGFGGEVVRFDEQSGRVIRNYNHRYYCEIFFDRVSLKRGQESN
jgi:hypothetical protein